MAISVARIELPEVLILEPKVFSDERGYFFEGFNARDEVIDVAVDIRKDSGNQQQVVNDYEK